MWRVILWLNYRFYLYDILEWREREGEGGRRRERERGREKELFFHVASIIYYTI